MKYNSPFTIETQRGYYPIGTWGFACNGGSSIEEAIQICNGLGREYRVVNALGGVLYPLGSKCQWTEEPEYKFWGTSCGQLFILNVGSLQENNFKYCPFCGSEIVEVRK